MARYLLILASIPNGRTGVRTLQGFGLNSTLKRPPPARSVDNHVGLALNFAPLSRRVGTQLCFDDEIAGAVWTGVEQPM